MQNVNSVVIIEGENELLACLELLYDSDCYGGITNTDTMSKGKLSETSWCLVVKNKENKYKQVPVVSHSPFP